MGAVYDKALILVDDSIEILTEALRGEYGNGAISVEYGPYGEDGVTAATGTILVEGTNSELAWYPLTLNNPDDTTSTSKAVPSLVWVDNPSYKKIRVRLSVAGGAQGVRVFARYGTP